MKAFLDSIKERMEILGKLVLERIYDGSTHVKFPHVRRLLLERYYFKIPESLARKLPEDMYEVHTYRSEWKKDPSSGMSFEVHIYDDGGETIHTESFKALSRRTAKRIASGILKVKNLISDGKRYPLLEFVEKASKGEKLELLNTLSRLFEFSIYHKIWLPSSPFMMNAGRGALDDPEILEILYRDYDSMSLEDYEIVSNIKDPAYGSCYAMGSIEDDIKSIFDMLYYQAEVFRHAGGFGVNFSQLRSKYAYVSTIKGRSSGPLMFMRLFNEVTYIIALHATTKRGANMFLLDVHHPEIFEFVNMKTDFDKGYQNVKYANISMAVDEDFLKALLDGREWELVDPHDPDIRLKVDPRKLWTNAVFNATLHAEPGILNLSAINKDNPIVDVEPITSVNPCAEFTGFDESVCVLGSVNLYSMLVERDGKIEFDHTALKSAVKTLHLFLTLAGTANEYPLESLTRKTRMYRNTGVGYMGLASTFVMMGMRYGSKEAFEFFRKIMKNFSRSVLESSVELGKLIGPHANFEKNRFVMKGKDLKRLFSWHPDAERFEDDKTYYVWNTSNPDATIELEENDVIANARLMAIAPTGSISYICQVSSGVEPIFSLAYVRRINPDMPSEYSVVVYDSSLEDYLRFYLGKDEREIDELVKKLANFDVPDEIENSSVLVTTFDVGTAKKIAILTLSNLYIDMNTSTTFNIQRSTKLDDLDELESFDEPFLKRALERFRSKRMDLKGIVKEDLLKDPHHLKAFIHFIASDPSNDPDVADEYRRMIFDIEDGKITPAEALRKIERRPEFEKALGIVQSVGDFYLLSQLLEMKGVTIYVEATRTPILKPKRKRENKKNVAIFDLGGLKVLMDTKSKHLIPKERPTIIPSLKKEVRFEENGIERKFYVELGHVNGEPFEVFFRSTNSTKEYTELFNAAGRLMSLAMRSGVDVKETIRQLRKVKNWKNEYSKVASMMAETVQELVEYLKKEKRGDWVLTSKGYYVDSEGKPRCPVCGGELVMKDGCAECTSCGWTACVDA